MNIFLFAILTIINIVLQTAHSVCLVKCNKIVASLVNAVAFAVYTIVVVFTARALVNNFAVDTIIKCSIVFVCNIFGTYLSLMLIDKLKKDNLWEIVTTIKDTSKVFKIANKLNDYDINYGIAELIEGYSLQIYSYSQADSLIIKELLTENNLKYIVLEQTVKL